MKQYSDEKIIDAYEMASLKPSRSGLPAEIWLDEAGQARQLPHKLARHKIRINGEFIPFTLEDEPKYLVPLTTLKKSEQNIAKVMLEFIKQNIDVFMAHWENQIDTFEAFETLIIRANAFI